MTERNNAVKILPFENQEEVLCEHCKKYSLSNDFKRLSLLEEVKGQIVWKNADYSRDIVADITYLTTYFICPKCNFQFQVGRKFLAESNKHRQ